MGSPLVKTQPRNGPTHTQHRVAGAGAVRKGQASNQPLAARATSSRLRAQSRDAAANQCPAPAATTTSSSAQQAGQAVRSICGAVEATPQQPVHARRRPGSEPCAGGSRLDHESPRCKTFGGESSGPHRTDRRNAARIRNTLRHESAGCPPAPGCAGPLLRTTQQPLVGTRWPSRRPTRRSQQRAR